MYPIVRDVPIGRQETQPDICPYCLQPSRAPGICADCKSRIKLASSARSTQVVVLPVVDLWDAPLPLQVLALMQDDGAIAAWMRPNVAAYAEQLDRSRDAIGRAIRRMVKMGWLETRGDIPHDYRMLIPELR